MMIKSENNYIEQETISEMKMKRKGTEERITIIENIFKEN